MRQTVEPSVHIQQASSDELSKRSVESISKSPDATPKFARMRTDRRVGCRTIGIRISGIASLTLWPPTQTPGDSIRDERHHGALCPQAI